MHLILRFQCLLALILLTSCGWRPNAVYQEFYSHLEDVKNEPCVDSIHSDYFLIIYVEACHLDYTSTLGLLQTIAKHPNGSTEGDVGHAWIHLQGLVDGKIVSIEGGHSGERGILQAKYFDGVMNYIDYGYANPSDKQIKTPRYEPNPIKYLWTSQQDGFFQRGSGGHTPTFAIKIPITPEQFERILSFIDPKNYCYKDYNLTRNQCSSFVAHVAALADFPIEYELTIPIDSSVYFRGRHVRLWEDPQYAYLRFSSPDIIERSLINATRNTQNP